MSYKYKRKIFLGKNVLEAAQERIKWIFDTFEQISLSFSGGKDSTVLFHPVSYTHLTLPTNVSMCRSRWSPYH